MEESPRLLYYNRLLGLILETDPPFKSEQFSLLSFSPVSLLSDIL